MRKEHKMETKFETKYFKRKNGKKVRASTKDLATIYETKYEPISRKEFFGNNG